MQRGMFRGGGGRFKGHGGQASGGSGQGAPRGGGSGGDRGGDRGRGGRGRGFNSSRGRGAPILHLDSVVGLAAVSFRPLVSGALKHVQCSFPILQVVVAGLVAQYLAQVAVAVELPMVMVVLGLDTKRVQVDLVMAQTMALAAVVWAAKAVVMAAWVQASVLAVL